jgi:peptidyl-prolyl cis-trans isomerase SurA
MIPRSFIARFVSACLGCAAIAASAQTPPAAPGKLDTQLAAPPASRIVPVDRIVAVVNDDVITQNDLNDRVALVVRQLQRQGAQLPQADVLSRQILERMINDRVQLQLAKESVINDDDLPLDRTIDRIAQENNIHIV